MTETSHYDAAFTETDVADELPELDFGPLSDDTLGLVMVGALRENINVAGHDITIRTLRIGEELEASLISNKYRETDDAGRAYATAIVAACIETVDGKPLAVGQLGPTDSLLDRKYQYIMNNWYWTSIRTVYNEYLLLLQRVNESVDEVKKD